jgi:hypothetical protein
LRSDAVVGRPATNCEVGGSCNRQPFNETHKTERNLRAEATYRNGFQDETSEKVTY